MKLAPLLALPLALTLPPQPEHFAVEFERARPLGFRTPFWERRTHDLTARAEQGWRECPSAVAARLKSFESEMLEPQALGRANTPSGLELWIFEQNHLDAGFPDHWRVFLRDPRTDALTPQTITLSDKWIETEAPCVRFIDLDDDGRDELAFRQFEHNGTMVNNAVELYFRVADDLSLNLCLVQRTEIRDLYSRDESGAIRSQLMLSDSGALTAEIWNENPRFSVPRVAIGRLQLELDPQGVFTVVSEQAMSVDDEHASRYDFALDHCFQESTTDFRGREFPRSELAVR
jgi:hypothetical protein